MLIAFFPKAKKKKKLFYLSFNHVLKLKHIFSSNLLYEEVLELENLVLEL